MEEHTITIELSGESRDVSHFMNLLQKRMPEILQEMHQEIRLMNPHSGHTLSVSDIYYAAMGS